MDFVVFLSRILRFVSPGNLTYLQIALVLWKFILKFHYDGSIAVVINWGQLFDCHTCGLLLAFSGYSMLVKVVI